MSKGFNKFITIILSIALSLFLISIAVKATLAFRQLYFYDLNYLNIAKDYGMAKEEIMKNYNILIDYTQKKSIAKLYMPSFPMSREGEIHFTEVKALFMRFNTLMYITGVVSLLGILLMIKERSYKFLKYSSTLLLAIPIVLSIPFAINFDESFTIFHKMFFKNNYWEFDPVKDPIINVLPQEFFFHCAILILLILATFSLICYVIYRKNKKIKNNLTFF
jgi:integral membrane protein (TIGR01906 family)